MPTAYGRGKRYGLASAVRCSERCDRPKLQLHRGLRECDPNIPLPGLQSSGATGVSPVLDGERTDKGKMMALLLELTRSPEETWFKEFIGALSKIPHYKTVVDHLLKSKMPIACNSALHFSTLIKYIVFSLCGTHLYLCIFHGA